MPIVGRDQPFVKGSYKMFWRVLPRSPNVKPRVFWSLSCLGITSISTKIGHRLISNRI